MGIMDRLRGQFIDIIEWLDPGGNVMVFRFERQGNEIKNGAKLIVREGQQAVFVSEGRIADVFYPGTHTLETQNLPILSTLLGWKYGFSSPFKAEVYFVATRRFTDLKWGTKNPVIMRDPEFGPVRLRAYGTYEMRVIFPANFIREIAGTDGHFTSGEITDQLRNIIVSRFTDTVGEQKIPILDLAGNYDEVGAQLTDIIAPEFNAYGLELAKLLVENVSLPTEVEKVLDKRTSMGILGDMNKYTQFQAANAMEAAAQNPGGSGMADGMGMGMGYAMAQQMGKAMGGQNQSPQTGSQQAPPPLPQAEQFFVAVNGQQAGPFDQAGLQGLAQAGNLTRTSLVWKAGMDQWQPAGQVAELAPLFSRTPPPLPGQN